MAWVLLLRARVLNWARGSLATSSAGKSRRQDGLDGVLTGPVIPYSSEVQQPIRATAVLGGRLHTGWTAPVEREQARAASLHPDGLRRAPCPLRARRQGPRRSVAVIHGQDKQPLTCKRSGQQGVTSQFPS